jgi:predicted Ser/Thr protein kinase
VYYFLKELLRQGILLDKIGLRHSQLQVGKNILVKEKVVRGKKRFEPVIIDFEKGSTTKGAPRNAPAKWGKNFGQLTSFLFYNPHGFVAKQIRKKLNLKL